MFDCQKNALRILTRLCVKSPSLRVGAMPTTFKILLCRGSSRVRDSCYDLIEKRGGIKNAVVLYGTTSCAATLRLLAKKSHAVFIKSLVYVRDAELGNVEVSD